MRRSLSMMPWWMDNVLSQVTGLSGKINEYILSKRRGVSFFLSLHPLVPWIAFHRPRWRWLSPPVNGCNVVSYRQRDTQKRWGDGVVIVRSFHHECWLLLSSCVVAFKYANCSVGWMTSPKWTASVITGGRQIGKSKLEILEIFLSIDEWTDSFRPAPLITRVSWEFLSMSWLMTIKGQIDSPQFKGVHVEMQ